jgi:phage shock protein E
MIYIDVRTKGEYDSGHVDGAMHWDIMDMMCGNFPDLAKDAPLLIYCESGNRSMMACSILKQNGWENVVDGGSIDDAMNRK